MRRILRRKVGDLERINHDTIRDYNEDLDDFFKFAFVRNPWDKMVSFYSYHKKRNFDRFPEASDPDFREFMLKVIGPPRRHGLFRRRETGNLRTANQLAWITDANGTLLMDFVGRFENLQEDFAAVCERIGIKARRLPHLNRSDHQHYSSYYDEDSIEVVRQRFQADIDYFGYQFEDRRA